MKKIIAVLWIAGVALFLGLIAWQGLPRVAGALAGAGWGIVAVCLYHFLPMVIDTIGWRKLLGPAHAGFGALLFGRWAGEAVNSLLPAAQIGGHVVRARVLALRGVPARVAGASVIVDVTLGVLAQAGFAMLGMLILASVFGQTSVALATLIGVLGFVAMIAVFVYLQHRGLFSLAALILKGMAGPFFRSLPEMAAGLDEAIRAIYRLRSTLFVAAIYRFTGWATGAGEVWLAFHFLGAPVSAIEAVLLESMAQAVRTVAFSVPGALGVQEGALLLVGGMIGVPADMALAMALIKRARELAVGLPGLAAWQLAEGRYWRRRRAARPAGLGGEVPGSPSRT